MRKAITLSVVVFTLAGLSLVGSTPASAGVLCKVNETPCSAENVKKHGAMAFFTGQLNFSGTFTCPGATFRAVTDVGGEGKPAKAEFGGLWGCKHAGFSHSCNTTFPNGPYDMEFEGSEGNGTMTLSDPVELKFAVQCFSFPMKTCTFSSKEGIVFQFTGGTPAVMTATNVALASQGSNCPPTATLSSELKTGSAESPEPLFVVGGPAPLRWLCAVNTNPCPEEDRYPSGTSLEGSLEGNSLFEFLYEGKLREPACESGAFSGKTTQDSIPLIGEVSTLSFSKCGGGVCAVQAQTPPFNASIEPTTGGNGTLTMGTGATPKIEVNCGGAFKCIYKAASVSFAVTGGNPAKLAVSQTLEKDAASGAECGSTMTWKATYKLTKPTPLFVTS